MQLHYWPKARNINIQDLCFFIIIILKSIVVKKTKKKAAVSGFTLSRPIKILHKNLMI